MSPAAMNRLFGVMEDIFRTPRAQLSASSKAEDIPDWDSLRTIYLATAVESEFSVTLTPEEIAGMVSVPEIVDILVAKGVT
jgi:acyl carrier protein